MTSIDNASDLVIGTWKSDEVHSTIAFSVRHLGISKAKGTFETFEAIVTTGSTFADSSVVVTIDVASITTGLDQRDQHLRTNEFFSAPEFPKITFRSTGISTAGDEFLVEGDLTLRGVTKHVTLETEFGGIYTDENGSTKMGIETTTKIDRTDFGVSWNAALEAGGFTLGNAVTITANLQFVLQPA